MLKFDDLDTDEESIVTDFCSGFETPTLDEVDEFAIVKDYIYRIDPFVDEVRFKFKAYLTIPLDPSEHVRYTTIGWHMAASILDTGGHSLDKETVEEFKEKIFKENHRINDEFILCSRGVAHDIIGNRPFFYKKSIKNVLMSCDIGRRLHPSFRKYNFERESHGMLRKNDVDSVVDGLYRSIKNTIWIRQMRINVGKTNGKYPSVFFYT